MSIAYVSSHPYLSHVYFRSSPIPSTTPVGPSAPFFLKELRNQLHKPGGVVVFEARIVASMFLYPSFVVLILLSDDGTTSGPEIVWLKDGQELKNYRIKTEYDPQSVRRCFKAITT